MVSVFHNFNNKVHVDRTQGLADFLNGPNAALTLKMKEFIADDELTVIPDGTPIDDQREITNQFLQKFTQKFARDLLHTKEYGGTADPADYIRAVSVLGHFDPNAFVKQGVNFGLGLRAILSMGNSGHREQFLEKVIKGDIQLCFAMTEEKSGSNVQGLTTQAHYNEDGTITLNTSEPGATKVYIGNATNAHYAVVFADLIMPDGSKGTHPFIVQLRDTETGELLPGIKVKDHGYKVGLNGVDNGTITFDNITLQKSALLDNFGSIDDQGNYNNPYNNPQRSDAANEAKRFFSMIGTLDSGRLSVGLAALNAAKNGFINSIEYAMNRQIGDKTLLEQPHFTTAIMPLIAANYAMHVTGQTYVDQMNDPEAFGTDEMKGKLAAFKVLATEDAFDSINKARQKTAGKGFMGFNRLGYLRDSIDVFQTFEGENVPLQYLTIRNPLRMFGKSLKGKITASLQMVGINVPALKARFNVRAQGASHRTLSSPDFLNQLINIREKSMRTELAARMQQDAKNDPRTKHQLLALSYAKAYGDQQVFQEFSKKIEEAKSPARETLNKLLVLHGISTIVKNKAWYLEQGIISRRQSKRLTKLQESLSLELAKQAPEIVSAFQVPTNVLQTPNPAAINDNKKSPPEPEAKVS